MSHIWFIPFFLIKFFIHPRWLLLHTVSQKVIEKLEGIFWTPIDSDAVFHEESEYVIGLMIWLTNDDVSSVFPHYLKLFSCKKPQKMTKIGKSISTVYQWRYGQIKKSFLAKWSARRALQTLKVSSNSDEVAGLTGDFPWIHP